MPAAATAKDHRAARVVTTAFLRTGELLGMSGRMLARTIGTSEASVSRLRSGKAAIDPESKDGELALLLIRLFDALDGLVGGSDAKARQWFHSENTHLNATPADLVQSAEGFVHAVEYLEHLRGKS